MSMILRSANLRVARAARPAARQVRAAHFENVVDQTIPGGCKNKTAFAARFFGLYAFGLALPFAATWYVQRKANA